MGTELEKLIDILIGAKACKSVAKVITEKMAMAVLWACL